MPDRAVTPPVTKESPPLILTNARSVDALKPRPERYTVRDSEVSGLELRVASDGTRTWSLRYRVHGLQRRLKLGEYPRLSLARARVQANQELRKVDGGIDPQAEREAERRAAEQAKQDSIEALCENYIEHHAKRKKRTWRDDLSKIKCEILPKWKGRSVTSITRRDCRELVDGIADRGAGVFANRIAALLSRMFRFAVDKEIVETNPAVHLPKPGVEVGSRPEGERERKAYDPDEIRAIWQATETLDPTLRAIYRLGLVTGQRPTEISGMEWRELDGSWWTIPGGRTKNGKEHRVYLTSTALDMLREIPRVDEEPRIFRGWRGKRQLAAVNAIVFAGVRRREKPRHALRDTVVTGLAEAGVAVEDIARVVNHTYGPKVTSIYNSYGYDKEKRAAMLKWERRLRAILESRADNGKVVSISAQRG